MRKPGPINARVRATKSRQNFSKPTHPIHTMDPKLRFSCVSFRLVAFGTIMLLHKLDAKRAKMVQLMQKFVPRCLVRSVAMNAPDPHHWNINSCFGAFLSARNLVQKRQTGAINANVYARCRARIFRNEHSRSIPLDPKLMFWCVSFRLGAFGTVLLLHETCCKTRQTGTSNAKVRATMSC